MVKTKICRPFLQMLCFYINGLTLIVESKIKKESSQFYTIIAIIAFSFSKSFKTDIFKEIRFFCTAIILSVTQKRLQYLMQSNDYLMLNDVPKMNQGFPSCEDLHLHTLCVFQRTHICYSVLTVNSLMAGHEGVWCYRET